MIIVVPYRDREEHLKIFIPHMQNYLQGVKICVVEQGDDKGFNRGKLLNIGYLENPDHDYYCFHDVDMLPVDADYSTPVRPTHIATECSQFNYKMPYPGYFGGVTLFLNAHFKRVNGYTNEIFSWGNEDDLLHRDCIWKGLKVDRRRCRFESLDHERVVDFTEYDKNKAKFLKGRNPDDGLNGCSYQVVSREEKKGFELIRVLL